MAKSKTIGATIKLGGEKEYRKAISDINSSMKVLRSEMKKSTAEFGSNSKSLKALTAEKKNLKSQIEQQTAKINTLRGAVESATKKYGENSKEVNKWKASLNEAETELAKMNDRLGDVEKQTKGLRKVETAFKDIKSKISEMKDNMPPAVKGLGNIVSAAGKLAKITFKATAASMAALGTTAVAVGKGVAKAVKASIEGFGDYEQLVGGVETLFKSSSNEVVKYANNAYKTAGLTANEYMETVTSFSASLLQSLNGDTAKAAQVADMAITDMSDNANKMGTDMSSIQNAYQGFAKQNYTMLDNLKLGYGGTQEEMERLLADAEKISGRKYDISNLNDVYQAIHVIQTNLGITGTTAKEASTTIQGSIKAVKSTFQNLITGLADENANIKQLVGNFTDSVITAGKNIIPRIVTIVKNIGPAISETVTTLLPQLIPVVSELINQLVNGIMQNLKPIIQAATTIVSTLAKALTEDDTITAIIDATLYLVDSIVGMLRNPEQLQKLIDAAIKITLEIASGLLQMMPQIIDAGLQLIKGLIKGLWNNRGLILSTIKQLGKTIISNIKAVFGIHSPSTIFADIGKNLILGLIRGLQNSLHLVVDKVKNLGNTVVNALKNKLGIHSPSTVFATLGDYSGQGFGVGFTRSMKKVKEKIKDILPTSINSDVGVRLKTAVQSQVASVEPTVHNNNTAGRIFNFNFNISLGGTPGKDFNVESAAEELSRQIYNNVKRKMEAFA
nr:MAG TPA: tail tape measure protein [Caudoviricetes sp.]